MQQGKAIDMKPIDNLRMKELLKIKAIVLNEQIKKEQVMLDADQSVRCTKETRD